MPKSEIRRSGGVGPHLSSAAVFRLTDAVPQVGANSGMKMRTTATLLAALAVGLLACATASAAMIGIYRNGLETLSQRSQLVKLSGRNCARGGVEGGMRILVGKKTGACALRTPVEGRDLEIATEQRLLAGTPKALQHKAYLGVELRAGGGAKYQLRVFPKQRKVQLLKVTPERTRYLAIEKNVEAVTGVNRMNAVRLRATNYTSGPEKGKTQLLALLGNTPVAEHLDPAGGELKGRSSAVIVGGTANDSNGVVAKVENVIVRIPSPYE